MRALLAWICVCAGTVFTLRAAEPSATWEDALGRMPLVSAIEELNRTNCVDLMLHSFQSNGVVKAFVFMPGATVEFYMFRRARARLNTPSPSLFDAVAALTNQSSIRATFRTPMLLLHTSEDFLEPDIRTDDVSALETLNKRVVPHLLFNDRDWDTVQPALKWPLKADVRPWQHSQDSWHFYRHSYAAWNLNGAEALRVTALAGKSRFSIRGKHIIFEPDRRAARR